MDLNRYKFYHYVDKDGSNVVVAVSSHAGRTVKGYARCTPEDNFDLEVGKKLAAARCNEKVLIKKLNSTVDKLSDVEFVISDLMTYRDEINERLFTINTALTEARGEVNDLLATLN